ncbi:MAG: S49 family peptidase [Planctomycetota bacterium]
MAIEADSQMVQQSHPLDRYAPSVRLLGPIALVPVLRIVQHVDEMDYWDPAGYSQVDELAAALTACELDDRCEAVLLTINSPGGETARYQHVIDAMASLAAVKPTLAYARGCMCSAAYWVGCVAHGVWADSDYAVVGSIGADWAFADLSAGMAADGVRVRHVTDTPGKVEMAGDQPITDDAVAHMRRVLGPMAEAFRGTVAARRGLSVAADQDGGFAAPFDGRTYSARDAIGLGLVDEVVPEAELLPRAAALFDELAAVLNPETIPNPETPQTVDKPEPATPAA